MGPDADGIPGEGTGPRPACFGDGATVCPQDADGFHQPQHSCLPCPHLRPCLRAALGHERPPLAQESEGGVGTRMSRFLQRWSAHKEAHERRRRRSPAPP